MDCDASILILKLILIQEGRPIVLKLILSQEGRPLAYFSEKLDEGKNRHMALIFI